jgi:hypothetical protein
MRKPRTSLLALLAALVLGAVSSCGGGVGAVLAGYYINDLWGTETSTISIMNAYSTLHLAVDEEFQLRVLHRQIRDDSLGRKYYYEEEVTAECRYTSSNSSVVTVDSEGRLIALAPGVATVSVLFNLPLQKADQAKLTVVVGSP